MITANFSDVRILRIFTVCFCFQTELCELREEVSELKSSRFKADTRLRQLDLSIAEKDAEVSRISSELNEVLK